MNLKWKDFALGSSDQEDLSYAMSKFYLLALSNAMHQGKNLYTLGGEYPTAGGKGQIFKYLLR